MKIHVRRGIGTVIGTAFFLLILLSGFSLFMYQLSSMKNYANVVSGVRELDQERSSEDIEVLGVTTTALDKLNITVRNAGSYQTHLIYLGIHDDATNSHDYYEIDFYIDPSETLTDVKNESITIPSGSEREIQLITSLGNIYTFTYPYSPSSGTGDGGSDLSSVTITGIGLPHNPSNWDLIGSTTNVSGSVSDLTDDDGNYTIFKSYPSGNNSEIQGFIDNNVSNVDGSADKGSHNNFPAQQAGPNGVSDTLIEEVSVSGAWVTPEGYMDPINQWSTEVNAYDNNTVTYSVNDVKKNKWSGYLVLTLSNPIKCGKIRYYIGRETSSIDQVEIEVYNGTWINVYSGVGIWDAWTNVSLTESSISQMRFSFENIAGVSTEAYVYEAEFLPTSAQLDLEVQWTNVEFDELNEWLYIYGGNMGTEDIRVDVWYNSTWNNIFTDLSSGWNNVSVSSYLDSSNFTIRFKGANETGDSTQDTWEIDAALLHLWSDSDRYTAEVEFTGTSNLEAWSEVEWHVSSSWDLDAIPVTIQLYNFTLGDYASNGDGFLSYVSDATPDTDELTNQTISSNLTDFRNATGHWRIRVKAEKLTFTRFQMKADWIVIKPIYPSAGASIEYNVWRKYRIKAYTSQGDPLLYGIVSVYGNGTSLSFRNAVTKIPISNPDWVYLDIDGMYQLELRSSFGASETFYLSTVMGSILDEKTIIQQSP